LAGVRSTDLCLFVSLLICLGFALCVVRGEIIIEGFEPGAVACNIRVRRNEDARMRDRSYRDVEMKDGEGQI
jgi:hypothetical protein